MSSLRQLPTWVYLLTDTNNDLLYVGVAVHLERRLAQHRATKSWWEGVVFIDAERYETRRQALRVEQHYIKTMRPIFNIVGLPPEIPRPHDPIGRMHYVWHEEVKRLVFDGRQGLVD